MDRIIPRLADPATLTEILAAAADKIRGRRYGNEHNLTLNMPDEHRKLLAADDERMGMALEALAQLAAEIEGHAEIAEHVAEARARQAA